MNLEIVSPEKIIYSGKVESVTLPGSVSPFTILKRHAPVISELEKGVISYSIDGKIEKLTVNGGFVEMHENNVSVCIE
jgi:F-type H+-transporting ATPase subunit epsilon